MRKRELDVIIDEFEKILTQKVKRQDYLCQKELEKDESSDCETHEIGFLQGECRTFEYVIRTLRLGAIPPIQTATEPFTK